MISTGQCAVGPPSSSGFHLPVGAPLGLQSLLCNLILIILRPPSFTQTHRKDTKLGRPIILSKANAVPAPHSPILAGEVTFDYDSHDGRYEIGHADLTFESRWSRASNTSIYCYNDAPSIRGVAVAPIGAEFSSLSDVSTLDFTSRVRCPALGQFVVLQNIKGFFALLRIESIADTTRGDHSNELRFRYWIRPDGGSDFSNEGG